MKKGTKHCVSEWQASAFRLFASFISNFSTPNGTVAPATPAAAAAAAVTRCVSTPVNQTPPDRQAAMFGGFGGGAPQRFEECYHCYSVAYADKSQLEVSQSQAGRQIVRQGLPAGDGSLMSPTNDSHSYHGLSSACWLLLCILCIGDCPSTCISYHSSSLGISLSPHRHDRPTILMTD